MRSKIGPKSNDFQSDDVKITLIITDHVVNLDHLLSNHLERNLIQQKKRVVKYFVIEIS